MTTSREMIQRLSEAAPEDRAAVLVLPNSAERDVLKQLAQSPRWDGDLNSKFGRDLLVEKEMASRWNGINFLTQYGYVVADVLYKLDKLVKS